MIFERCAYQPQAGDESSSTTAQRCEVHRRGEVIDLRLPDSAAADALTVTIPGGHSACRPGDGFRTFVKLVPRRNGLDLPACLPPDRSQGGRSSVGRSACTADGADSQCR